MAEQNPQMEEKKADPKDLEENKGITFLSYIGILCLIPLLSKKESQFAQYHAKQGLALFICMIIIPLIAVIPVIGWIIFVVGWITAVVLAITGLINVSKGVMKPLPLLGPLAAKINL